MSLISTSVFVLKEDGETLGCGYNYISGSATNLLFIGSPYGRASIYTLMTQPPRSDVRIKKIISGDINVFILYEDGSCYCIGENSSGELGVGDSTDKGVVCGNTVDEYVVTDISAGLYYTAQVRSDGTLWVTGDNAYGQLGLGDTTDVLTWTQVADVTDVKRVFCGRRTTFILKNDGTLWVTGQNSYGNCGLGDTGSTVYYNFTQVNIDDVKDVYLSYYCSYVLKNDGTLWGCGYNSYGELGSSTQKIATFTQIASDCKQALATYYSLCVIKNDGTVWGCGYNSIGELGLGNTTKTTTLTQVTDITDVNKGFSFYYGFALVKNDGTVWSAGENGYGELGDGTTTDSTTFVQALGVTDVVYTLDEIIEYVSVPDDEELARVLNNSKKVICGDTLINRIEWNSKVIWERSLSDYTIVACADITSTSDSCYSIDGGKTFTSYDGDYSMCSAFYKDGMYFMGDSDNNLLYYSYDGIEWTVASGYNTVRYIRNIGHQVFDDGTELWSMNITNTETNSQRLMYSYDGTYWYNCYSKGNRMYTCDVWGGKDMIYTYGLGVYDISTGTWVNSQSISGDETPRHTHIHNNKYWLLGLTEVSYADDCLGEWTTVKVFETEDSIDANGFASYENYYAYSTDTKIYCINLDTLTLVDVPIPQDSLEIRSTYLGICFHNGQLYYVKTGGTYVGSELIKVSKDFTSAEIISTSPYLWSADALCIGNRITQ